VISSPSEYVCYVVSWLSIGKSIQLLAKVNGHVLSLLDVFRVFVKKFLVLECHISQGKP
jgi:hypothetical protein